MVDLGLANHHMQTLLTDLASGSHPELAALDLRGNTLGVKASQALLSVVERCTKLVRLALDDAADMSPSVANKIQMLLLNRGGLLRAPSEEEWRFVGKLGRIAAG